MARSLTQSRNEQVRCAMNRAHRNMTELARTRQTPRRRDLNLAGVARAREALAHARRR